MIDRKDRRTEGIGVIVRDDSAKLGDVLLLGSAQAAGLPLRLPYF